MEGQYPFHGFFGVTIIFIGSRLQIFSIEALICPKMITLVYEIFQISVKTIPLLFSNATQWA